MFACSKCNHKWFQRTAKPPRRCPNHACRSVYWSSEPKADFEKKSVASPTVVTEPPKETKAAVLSELQAIMTAVKEKPKTNEYRPSPVTYQQNVKVDEWGEVIHDIT